MAGKIKNCPMCGRLFSDTGTHVCQSCYRKVQEKEMEVVNYVRDNPGATVSDIMEATEAPDSMIKRMIREGRFEQIGVKMSYPCEKCGAPIISGKLCSRCQENMHKELQKQASAIVAARQKAQKSGQSRGMYSKPKL